jgi:hypothetical protein
MDIEPKKNQKRKVEEDSDGGTDEKAIEITGGSTGQEHIEENQTELEKLAKRENEKKKFLNELTSKDKIEAEAAVIKPISKFNIRKRRKLEPTD